MKPIATGGLRMPQLIKRNMIVAVVLFSLPVLSPAQQQVKKGRWFIGHSIGGPAYETTNIKTYNNSGVLTSHTKFSGLFFNLSFTGPSWGSIAANDYQQEDVLGGDKVDNSSFSISLQPTAGIFVRDNLVVGASLLLSGSSSRAEYTQNDGTSSASSFGVGIGPLIRYYMGGRTKAKPFVGLESRYTIYAFKQKSSTVQAATTYRSERDQNNKNIMVLPQLGYAWFPGKRWILELRLEYEYNNVNVDSKEQQFTNNVMNAGYPRRSSSDQTLHGVGVKAGIAFTMN